MPDKLCVLPDTSIIIEAHVLGVWSAMTTRLSICLPSTIVKEADYYPVGEEGLSQDINLTDLITRNVIREVDVTIDQIDRLRSRLDRVVLERIDPGERDALALLLDKAIPNTLFCVNDDPAVRALCLLDIADCGISFQKLLERHLGMTKSLRNRFTERRFAELLTQGHLDRVQGVGLRAAEGIPASPRGSRRSGRTSGRRH